MFDRDAALAVLHERLGQGQWTRLLEELAGCVRPVPPQIIDRDELKSLLWMAARHGEQPGVTADSILALVRPVPPQVIDRDILVDLLMEKRDSAPRHPNDYDSESLADDVLALVVPDSRFDTIRALHYEQRAGGFVWCKECTGMGWPCATIRALDGNSDV